MTLTKFIHSKDIKLEYDFILFLNPLALCLPQHRQAKSLYRSFVGSHFYGTEYEICADFGLVGNTEKNGGQLGATLEAGLFMFSWAKKMLKFFQKHCSVRTKKFHNIFFIILF